jgi:hypothetical protein
MARTDHGGFVAAARALHAAGWRRPAGAVGAVLARGGEDIVVTTSNALQVFTDQWNIDALGGQVLLDARPASVQQGVDQLVVLGLLPAAHASWTCGPTSTLVDSDGKGWTWHQAGYLREDDAETLTLAQVVRDFEAVPV